MFTFHNHGGQPVSGRSVAQVQQHELHQDHSAGPLDGQLFDLCAACLIIVPVALFLKLVLF